jgi:hypothetical protein
MSVIELFWFLYFEGGGAVAGWRLAGVAGGVVGGGLGCCFLYLMARLSSYESSRMPGCECGAPWATLVFEKHASLGHVHRCATCSRTYDIQSGTRWYLMTGTDELVLIARRTFWGNWRPEPNKPDSAPPGSVT